jgi:DNA-directed RNA polymerase subunit M/transcription elongation factor TFIIS
MRNSPEPGSVLTKQKSQGYLSNYAACGNKIGKEDEIAVVIFTHPYKCAQIVQQLHRTAESSTTFYVCWRSTGTAAL